MKLLVFTDVHGHNSSIKSIIKKAKKEKPDFLVCAGDLTDWGRGVKKVLKKFEELKIPLLLISGNHEESIDLRKISSKFEYVIFLDNGSYEFEDFIFFGYGDGVFATKDKFVAAIYRIPANVQGDGIHTIKGLIEIKNKDPRRGAGHKKSLVRINVDSVVKEHLKKQKLRLSSIPKKDEIIYLRVNSNLSTGGDSVDVTDVIHPEVKKLAVKVIKVIPGLAYGGIDYLTKDVTVAPTSRNYIVIEVNDSPMLSMHHIPYSGKERDAAGAVIDQLFPETKSKKQ